MANTLLRRMPWSASTYGWPFEPHLAVFCDGMKTLTSGFEISRRVLKLQRRFLKLQRRVLKLQRRFLKLQRRVLKLQRRFLKLQRRVLKLQRRFLKLQRRVLKLQRRFLKLQHRVIYIYISNTDVEVSNTDVQVSVTDVEVSNTDVEVCIPWQKHCEMCTKARYIQTIHPVIMSGTVWDTLRVIMVMGYFFRQMIYLFLSCIDYIYVAGANESSNKITPEFIGRWFIP